MENEVLTIIDKLIQRNLNFISRIKEKENNILSFDEFKEREREEQEKFIRKVKEQYADDKRIDWVIFDYFYNASIENVEGYNIKEQEEEVRKYLLSKYSKRVTLDNKKSLSKTLHLALLADGSPDFKLLNKADETFKVGLSKYAMEDLFNSLYNIYLEEERLKLKKPRDILKFEMRTLNEIKSEVLKVNFNLEELLDKISKLDFEDEYKNELEEAVKRLKIKKEEKELEKEQARLEYLRLQRDNISENIHCIEPEKVIFLSINNYEYLQEVIDTYGLEILDGISEDSLNDEYSLSDLRQISNYSFIDVDDEVYQASFNSILYFLDKATFKTDFEIYRDLMFQLCDKYEKYCDYRDVYNEIRSFFRMPELTEKENATLMDLLSDYRSIMELPDDSSKEKAVQLLNSTLAKLRRERYSTREENEKIPIKGFVLFDCEKSKKGQLNPYVVKDLDPSCSNNMIDDSIDRQKMDISGYRDISDLVDIIVATGTLGETVENDPKLIRPVLKKVNKKNLDTSMANATGMLRIRPRNSSLARFIERKFDFKVGTIKYDQIKSIFEKILPGADINGDFTIFMNYLCALKCKDWDPYNAVKSRYDESNLTKIFLNKERDIFTKEELKEIADVLQASLQAYSKLSEIDSTLSFDMVNNINKEYEKKND